LKCKHQYISTVNYHLTLLLSDEKPFKCDECPKRFKAQKYLKLHTSFHKKRRFVCQECGKAYVSNFYLKNHFLKSHGSKLLLMKHVVVSELSC